MTPRRHVSDPGQVLPRRERVAFLVCLVLWSILSYVLISHHVISSAEIAGQSMCPTLLDGERYLVNRLMYKFGDPQPGDIVVVTFPGTDGISVKRIVAVPDQVIRFAGLDVFVDGRKLSEPYLAPFTFTFQGNLPSDTYQVPPDMYFVLGDNRESSGDSRLYGPVARSDIKGMVWRPLTVPLPQAHVH